MPGSYFAAGRIASRRVEELASFNEAPGRPPTSPLFSIALVASLVIAGFAFLAPPAASTALISQIGLDIDGEAAGDESGYSVSMSSDGSRVAIGARVNGDAGTVAGHVRIYSWDGSSWIQLGEDIDGDAALDYSGHSVSLSGDGSTVAIGSLIANSQRGEVRVFSWDGSAWNQLGIDLQGEANQDYFGSSVSLSSDGSTVAIGATGDDGNGDKAGQVRVYNWDGSAWSQVGSDLNGEGRNVQSGNSVSLSSDGSIVAIGAPGAGAPGESLPGHVRVYEWNGSAWSQLGSDIDGEAASDSSGWSVALSSEGSRVAVGAHFNDGNGGASGHVRVYDWDGSTWVQLGVDIDGEAANDQFGITVSLSANGSRLAVGARGNDGNGGDSGHARLFDWDGSSWVQLGEDIDGEAAGDESGWAVSLASNGSRLAIGAPKNDGGSGTDAGHVRVYGLPALEPEGDSANSGEDSHNSASSTSRSDSSSPGIFLALSGRVGDQVEGSVVHFGSYAIAPSSPFSLTVEGISGTSFPRSVLARGIANGRGHLESEARLSALPEGAFKIVMIGYSAAGAPLILTNHISVDGMGQFKTVSPEDVQPKLR